MTRRAALLGVVLLAGCRSLATSEPPFEVTIIRSIPPKVAAPAYDPALPGYRLAGQIGELRIRPRLAKCPDKFVLVLTTGAMLEGFTLQSTGTTVQAGLKLAEEEVTHRPAGESELVPAGTYFQIKAVGRKVHVSFQRPARELLSGDCVIRWVDWYR